MLEFILKEDKEVPKRYVIASGDVFFYGAGDLGGMATDSFHAIGKKPIAIIDKDKEKQGGEIVGTEIISPEKLTKEQLENAAFVICIVKEPYSVIEKELLMLGCKHILHFYDMTNAFPEMGITNGWRLQELIDFDRKEIERVYAGLADEVSRAYYLKVLYWRIGHEEVCEDIAPINSDDKFFPDFIERLLRHDEVFVDGGAYIGNTIARFLEKVKGDFCKVIAFEPDRENFIQLCKYVGNLPTEIKERIYLHEKGVGALNTTNNFWRRGLSSRFCKNETTEKVPIVSLDDCIKANITFLKLHLEGMEYEALLGSINIIEKCRPIVVVTLYHSKEGCYKVPLFLMDRLRNYSYYYRVHMYCGQSSVLYAIPDERNIAREN